MGYGGLEVYLAGYPPQFSTSCGKGLPRMGKQKSGAAVKGRNAQQQAANILSEWRQAAEFLKAFQAEGQHLPGLAALVIRAVFTVSSYRRPMHVREYILYRSTFGGESAFYFCPRCGITMEREYQAYCDRCGQRLSWSRIEQAEQRLP